MGYTVQVETLYLRAADGWAVAPISHARAVAFVERHHYSRSAANTSVARHGLLDLGGALRGVAMWMPPTKIAAESVSDDWRSVLCLSRLAVAPGVPTNGASFLLGRSMKLLDPRWSTLLTYADTAEGHTGAIYRATNWTECGRRKGEPRWRHRSTGELRGRKRGGRNLTRAELGEAGFERLAPMDKIKFSFQRR